MKKMVRFRKITAFDGYRVGDDGSVWSKKRSGGRWTRLKPWPNQKGYLQVNLYSNNRGNTKKVHRLVAEAFMGTCPAGMECRHLDGDRTNNRLENLQWGTSEENKQDMFAHGTITIGEKNGRSVLTSADVIKIRKIYDNVDVSQRQLAKLYCVSKGTITSIISRKTWKHLL